MKKQNPGCNCCVSCEIKFDDFTRADASTPGADYTVVSGQYNISSNKLIPFTAGLCILNTAHPDGSEQCHLEFTLTADSNTDTAKIVFDYIDASNYHYAEIGWGTISAGAHGHLKFYKRTGGVDTQKGSTITITDLNAGDTATLALCFYGYYVEATVNGISGGAATTAHGGDQVGVAGGSSGVAWDDFRFSHVATEGGAYASCPDCQATTSCTPCADGVVTTEYKTVIAGVTNGTCGSANCGALNGTWIVRMQGIAAAEIPGSGNCRGNVYTGLTNCSVAVNSWYVSLGMSDADAGAGVDFWIYVSVGAFTTGFTYFRFRYNYGASPPNCAELVDVNVPYYDSSGAVCNGTAATCYVTAL